MQAEPAKQPDRRNDRRRPVDVFVNRFLNGYPFMCRAMDISRTGMKLVPLLEPTDKTPRFMGLQFQLPGTREVISASGEAVFADGEDGPVGVRFTRLSPVEADLIEKFVAAER